MIKNKRMTRQRKVILEELKKLKSHPCADEVYEIVRKRLPRISLGTVYRNLEILAGMGEIQKLELGSSQMRFDGSISHHHHIRCIRCERIEDLPKRKCFDIEETMKSVKNYKVLGHTLELIGICPDCRKKETKRGKFEKREKKM